MCDRMPALRSKPGNGTSNGSMAPHGRSRKFRRPVMMSRRAGMQGADPSQWLSWTTPLVARRLMLGARTQSLP